MEATYQLLVILAIVFGHLQFQSMVLAGPGFRSPNAKIFTPARTYGGGFNHSTVNSFKNTNWTAPAVHQPVLQAPGFTIPAQNRSWAHTHQGTHGAFPGSVPAQAAGLSSGWASSNNHQPGGVTGFFQPNPSQGNVGVPAFVFAKNNGTFYSKNSTKVYGRTNPYGNLSI
ncbi:uncharacterized protein LOC26527061 [Drosophila erecta]|uniref:Uncharacterized protein n=1 Tax=Drosophila erecta TaxID=7220 RepID=A0A0Q5UH35_DROER|nr:uncharacterized protein LOC26527061 [Drosophila erecta]KQS43010.1 uncharacterized protein Dere_GG27237 [Drosophila erecta]